MTSGTYQIKYAPLAQSALREAVAYIHENSGPSRAQSWLRSMLESVSKLEKLPKAFGVWSTREGQVVFSNLVETSSRVGQGKNVGMGQTSSVANT